MHAHWPIFIVNKHTKYVNKWECTMWQFIKSYQLMLGFHVSVLLLIMNFIITLSEYLWIYEPIAKLIRRYSLVIWKANLINSRSNHFRSRYIEYVMQHIFRKKKSKRRHSELNTLISRLVSILVFQTMLFPLLEIQSSFDWKYQEFIWKK